ncbi:Nucleotide-diphospho-sugar transferase [Spatholobus suberectus]|nr:Nucleotide-diphospho-sugar transferase [Spatholobus suberectus]
MPRTLPSNRRRFQATSHRRAAASFPAVMSPESTALHLRRALLFFAVSLSCVLLFRNAYYSRLASSNPLLRFSPVFPSNDSVAVSNEYPLEKILNAAAMEDRTVILTTLNEAWAAPNSIVDLFLESFRIGDRTRRLLNHLVIIALDWKAFMRCQEIHTYCYLLASEDIDFHEEAYFMTPHYLKMMWRRIDFLRSVLEMGYNFVFTDADIMWFRDPFPRFHSDADFQIACDHFTGSFDDVQNRPNGGFNFVKSNNRSIEFYKFWYSSQATYPGYHDQDVLNFIKVDPFITDLGLKMKFLDTANFGGLCEPSRDLNKVCTMHANCCYGLDSKLHDLRLMLQDWKYYLTLPPSLKRLSIFSWRVPQKCSLDSLKHHGSPEKSVQED